MKPHVESPTREVLAEKAGAQLHVTAVYVRTGERRSTRNPHGTVLLQDIRDAETGELLTDHLWFNHGQVWRSANLCSGDVVAFDARAIEYRTGYWGPNRVRQADAPARRDYRLTPPKGLTVVAAVRRGGMSPFIPVPTTSRFSPCARQTLYSSEQ